MITLPSIRRLPLCPTLIVATLLATPFGMTACSSGGTSSGTGGATGASSSAGTGGKAVSTSTSVSTTTSVSTSTSSTGSGMTCPPTMKYGGGEVSMTGVSAKAKIVDEKGMPVGGQPIYICGIDLCTPPSTTAADGTVSIMTGTLKEKKPAFKFGDTLSYAELAIPLTMATNDFTTGNMVLATGKLSDKASAPLTPGTDATSGDVTISVPAGANVGFDLITYDTPDKQKLRTVNIPLANVGPVLDPVMVGGASADFALLYGLAPTETLVCPAAKVTVAIPASLGWAAGTAVEFWIMTTDTGQTYAPYAGWAKMSDGVVSADGKTVSTVPGQGFVLLENFAIRKKT